MELFHGTAIPDLELRSGGDGRTIYGIAVPWNAPTWINDDLAEGFEPGVFDHQMRAANRVWFAREHIKLGGRQIGVPTMMRNDAAGLYVELRTSKTPLGDETLELFRDGALRELSVMFAPVQNRRVHLPAEEVRAAAGGYRPVQSGNVSVTMRTKAHLREIALVLMGAYGELAAGAGIRSAAEQPTVEQFVTPRRDEAQRILADLKAKTI